MKIIKLPVEGAPELVEVEDELDYLQIQSRLRQILGGSISMVMQDQIVRDSGLNDEYLPVAPVAVVLAGQADQSEGVAFEPYGLRGPVLLVGLNQTSVRSQDRVTEPPGDLISRWLPGVGVA